MGALPKLSTPDQVVDLLRPGMTVYLPGLSGESQTFLAALLRRPEAAAGVCFTGVHFPGINRSNYLGLHPQARQRAYFMQPALRAGFAEGRSELLPLDYPGIFRDLSALGNIDIALAQVAPPARDGRCSLGPSWDFHCAVWPRAKIRIGHINPSFPRTRGSQPLDRASFDTLFEADEPMLGYDSGEPDEAMTAHAAHVAGLVRDGDTLEFGVGKLQAAILRALRNHRRLRIYSGMVSAPVADLLDHGAIEGEAAIQAGVALGDAAFYQRIGADASFYFRPVSETHDVRRIGAIDNFCAINSAIEVDLFGQVNADSLNGRLVAGVGGMPAFVGGARMAAGGRSIIALPSTADGGAVSRIVATLGAGSLAALPRHEADYIVTEFGVAQLRGLSLHQRAQALIGVAAPQFRDSLAGAWQQIAARF
jgi:acyl-CoA hydrolase